MSAMSRALLSVFIAASLTTLSLMVVTKRTAADATSERKINEAAYAKQAESLRKQHTGKWVAIAGGTVLGTFEAFEAADAAVAKAAPNAKHAFIYQPGIDDRDVEFMISPNPPEIQNRMQIGTRFRKRAKIDEAFYVGTKLVWKRDGKEKSWETTDVSRATVTIADAKGKRKRELDFIVSGSFAWDITLTEQHAQALGLDRWSVPGRAVPIDGSKGTFRKVRCRLQVAELELDEIATAFVLP